ncbi:MAG: hypothetical protein ACO3B3_03125 [Cyanobium sp.]
MSAARGGPRGIPTSRAYWELQAEKLLNRVFEPATAIDLEPLDGDPVAPSSSQVAAPDPAPLADTGSAAPASTAPASSADGVDRRRRARRPGFPGPAAASRSAPVPDTGSAPLPAGRGAWAQPLLLVAVFAGAGLVTAISGVLALSQWNRYQEALQQERNLLLVERLRSFGPAAQPAPATPPAPALAPPASTATTASGGPTDASALPPPPPNEPWIEELASLPQPAQRPAALLRVPVSASLGAAAAPSQAALAPQRRAPAGPVPLLVGVVAVPGKPGSAIFQMGGSTTTVTVGESIGGSGWRLIASDGDSVQIEHQGEVRRLSIGSGG